VLHALRENFKNLCHTTQDLSTRLKEQYYRPTTLGWTQTALVLRHHFAKIRGSGLVSIEEIKKIEERDDS